MQGLLFAAIALAPVAAQIAVKDDSGKMIRPFAEAKPVVLIYTLAECPISAKYSPEIRRLVPAYPGVRFFLVHTDPAATVTVAKKHRQEFHIPCPEVLDSKRELLKLAHPVAVPTAALFDAQGRMRYLGRIDDRFPALGVERAPNRHDLRIALDQVLAGKPVTERTTPVVGCAVPR